MVIAEIFKEKIAKDMFPHISKTTFLLFDKYDAKLNAEEAISMHNIYTLIDSDFYDNYVRKWNLKRIFFANRKHF